MHVESLTRLPQQRGSAVAELERLLARLRWRLGLEQTALAAVHGAIASSFALILLALARWITAAEVTWLWLAAAPLVAALGLAVLRWPSRSQTALVADRHLRLEERLSTAVELVDSGGAGRFDLLQVRDTVSRASVAPRTWLVLTARTRNEALIGLAILVVGIGLIFGLSYISRPMPSPGELRTDLTDISALDVAADRTLPIDESAPEQTASLAPRAQATPPPADLASRVQQEQAERAALDKLAQGLGSVSAGQGAADAIQRGDFGAARDQIRSLGEEADQLSDAAKQQLARGLQQASTATGQSDRALADREQQAAQALSRSSYTDQRQALGALADQVQRSGSRSAPADQLEREQAQLQQQQQQQAGGSQNSAAQRGQQANSGQSGAQASQSGSQSGDQGSPQSSPGAGGQSPADAGSATQGGSGVGSGDAADPFSNQASRLDTAGQQVQVPTKLGNGSGVRPTDGSEDQSSPDSSLGGQAVAEQAQAQQTGQVSPEQNLVPGEQRPVVRGYFR
jgi:hypothetical protein